jgi:1-phosphofructokinase
MRDMLTAENIELHLTETASETRMNIKIITEAGETTEASERGGPVSVSELNTLCDALYKGCGELLVLGGSIPQGVDKCVYNSVITVLKEFGVRTVLDCDGDALRLGIDAKPTLIKPNNLELSEYLGKKIDRLRSTLKLFAILF